MNLHERAIAAVFPSREAAGSALQRLKAESFAEPWMATTQPAALDEKKSEQLDSAAAPVAGAPARNDVDDSSDGMLGTIGRFFSGEGNSLRRSLEDHGIDPLDAAAIDAGLSPLSSIVTVFVGDRAGLAQSILEESGGRLTRLGGNDAAYADRVERSLVVVDTAFNPPMKNEDVFVERRPVSSSDVVR